MSRGKMVLFFKFCFPLFLEIVLKVIRQETTKGKIPSFKNDSVFSNSSKIPYIETDHWWRHRVVFTWPLVTNTYWSHACQDPYRNDRFKDGGSTLLRRFIRINSFCDNYCTLKPVNSTESHGLKLTLKSIYLFSVCLCGKGQQFSSF